ncbi:hypothetical protein PI124_g7295 [Phytophthora idaei]|nr:hypothetical protein PI125_g24031 [Phytophthora idaei]KAG3161028.1 hypothetical protein PI126_g6643 [Phytophthora idaei]KAG3248046.1 hypothetical protein PI124_g7295 [Phytophthora idaei]
MFSILPSWFWNTSSAEIRHHSSRDEVRLLLFTPLVSPTSMARDDTRAPFHAALVSEKSVRIMRLFDD